jgi:hypothetical protein
MVVAAPRGVLDVRKEIRSKHHHAAFGPFLICFKARRAAREVPSCVHLCPVA